MTPRGRYEYQKTRNARLGMVRISVDVPAETVEHVRGYARKMRKDFLVAGRDPQAAMAIYLEHRHRFKDDHNAAKGTRYNYDPRPPSHGPQVAEPLPPILDVPRFEPAPTPYQPQPYSPSPSPSPYDPQDPTAPAPSTYRRSTPEELQVVRRELEKIDALEAQMIAEGRTPRTMNMPTDQTPDDPPADPPTQTPSWV